MILFRERQIFVNDLKSHQPLTFVVSVLSGTMKRIQCLFLVQKKLILFYLIFKRKFLSFGSNVEDKKLPLHFFCGSTTLQYFLKTSRSTQNPFKQQGTVSYGLDLLWIPPSVITGRGHRNEGRNTQTTQTSVWVLSSRK